MKVWIILSNIREHHVRISTLRLLPNMFSITLNIRFVISTPESLRIAFMRLRDFMIVRCAFVQFSSNVKTKFKQDPRNFVSCFLLLFRRFFWWPDFETGRPSNRGKVFLSISMCWWTACAALFEYDVIDVSSFSTVLTSIGDFAFVKESKNRFDCVLKICLITRSIDRAGRSLDTIPLSRLNSVT